MHDIARDILTAVTREPYNKTGPPISTVSILPLTGSAAVDSIAVLVNSCAEISDFRCSHNVVSSDLIEIAKAHCKKSPIPIANHG